MATWVIGKGPVVGEVVEEQVPRLDVQQVDGRGLLVLDGGAVQEIDAGRFPGEHRQP